MTNQKVKNILKPEVAEALNNLKQAQGPAAAEASERAPAATVRRRKRPQARPEAELSADDIPESFKQQFRTGNGNGQQDVPEVANGRDI